MTQEAEPLLSKGPGEFGCVPPLPHPQEKDLETIFCTPALLQSLPNLDLFVCRGDHGHLPHLAVNDVLWQVKLINHALAEAQGLLPLRRCLQTPNRS